MNGNEGSTPQSLDRDEAPDLSRDGWPEKFAKAPVCRGRLRAERPTVASPILLARH